jgi:uncharacterized LabA/DUF88 family protein
MLDSQAGNGYTTDVIPSGSSLFRRSRASRGADFCLGRRFRVARIVAYVDGFNVYHALEENSSYHKYKWLDYKALAQCYVGGTDTLEHVYLFTALATWNPAKARRHQLYLRALRARGVEIIQGKFKRKDRYCRLCRRRYQSFEEKLTDVNIAIHLFRGAYLDEYDRALLVSADTDIIPAISMVRQLFLTKQVGVVVPIGRFGMELKKECDFHHQMKQSQLVRSQLPEEVDDPVYGKICRPPTWN